MLAPLPIHFDASWHRYCWQPTGEWLLHSVTKVTGASKSESQKAVFLKTQHLWEPRGKHVHACLEAFLSGGPQLDAGDYGDWVEPLVAHPFWSKVTPLAIEYRVCDLGRSIGGSLDALVQHNNGKVLLLDLKTQSSARASTYSTDAQLGGYLSMLKLHHPALYVDECLTVWSKPGKSVITRAAAAQCGAAWAGAVEQFMDCQEFL